METEKIIEKDGMLYGVVYILKFPCDPDPMMESLTIFSSLDKALERCEEVIDEFINDYDEDYIEHATKDKPVAIMFNGEVYGYAYIVEVSNMAIGNVHTMEEK